MTEIVGADKIRRDCDFSRIIHYINCGKYKIKKPIIGSRIEINLK